MFNKIFVFVVSVASTLALNGIFTPIARGTTPDIVGQWELVTPALPYFPVHVNLLPTGKLMIWPGDLGISGNDPRTWDPSNNTLTNLSKPGYDLFASDMCLWPMVPCFWRAVIFLILSDCPKHPNMIS